MKNILISLILGIILCGCKTTPTPEKMTNIGNLSGYTTAIMLNNNTNITETTLSTIVEVVKVVKTITPKTNSTFTSTWIPISNKYIDKLIFENKIIEKDGVIVKTYFNNIVSLIDVYIDKKQIRERQDLINIFVHSYCNSFLENLKINKLITIKKEELDKFTIDFFETKRMD
jgi:hypothetical protein